jgi:hypothetical protein
MEFRGSLPESVWELLKNCPLSGSGQRLVHRWIMEVGLRLRHYVLMETAADLILRHISRRPKPREIEDSLDRAYGEAAKLDLFSRCWPQARADLIDQMVTDYDCGPALKILRGTSKSIPPTAAEIIASLFSPETFLCVGLYQSNSTIARVRKLQNLERFQFIVPNPMRERFVIDPLSGKRSERCLANIASRRYIVLDFDLKGFWIEPVLRRWASLKYTPQDGMAALIRLMTRPPSSAPLALVVFSGNVSLQAWFYCAGVSEERIARWFNEACLLGADPAGWVRCQYFRMPGAMRKEPPARQEVIFFDPASIS